MRHYSTRQLERIQFNRNVASEKTLGVPVAAAFFVERTGLVDPNSNATNEVKSSGRDGSSATVQAGESSPTPTVVGTGFDLFCFQNEPYDCEGYFGQATLTVTGDLRCATCEGDALTGIGSPAGVSTPAPAAVDDDDGLSKMGQERAQGGTGAPMATGDRDSSSSNNSSSSSGNPSPLGEVAEEEPELFGASGSMRWVVMGLMAALGTALVCCLCLIVMCRTGKVRKGNMKRSNSLRLRNMDKRGGGDRDNVEEDYVIAARLGQPSATVFQDPENSPRMATSQYFAASPGGKSKKKNSDPSSIDETSLAERQSREVARQRVLQTSGDPDLNAEEGHWEGADSGSGWEESGPGLAIRSSPARNSVTRKGFSALPDTEVGKEGRSLGTGGVVVGTNRGRTSRRGEPEESSDSCEVKSRSRSRGRGRKKVQDSAEENLMLSTEYGLSDSRHGTATSPAGDFPLPVTPRQISSAKSVGRGPRSGGERSRGMSSHNSRSPNGRAESASSSPDSRPMHRGSGAAGTASQLSPRDFEMSTSEAMTLKALPAETPGGVMGTLSREPSGKSRRSSRNLSREPSPGSGTRHPAGEAPVLSSGLPTAAAAGVVEGGTRDTRIKRSGSRSKNRSKSRSPNLDAAASVAAAAPALPELSRRRVRPALETLVYGDSPTARAGTISARASGRNLSRGSRSPQGRESRWSSRSTEAGRGRTSEGLYREQRVSSSRSRERIQERSGEGRFSGSTTRVASYYDPYQNQVGTDGWASDLYQQDRRGRASSTRRRGSERGGGRTEEETNPWSADVAIGVNSADIL